MLVNLIWSIVQDIGASNIVKKSENVPKKVGGGFESVSTVRLLTVTTLCGGKGNNNSYSSGVYIDMLSVRIS